MRKLLLAALLAITFASPAVAAPQNQVAYSITDNRRILTIYPKDNPEAHVIASLDGIPKTQDMGWFRVKNGFVPFTMTDTGLPLVADTPLYIPDESNMVASDVMSGGFLRDQTNSATYGALVVSNGAGPGLSISGTYNSTAPVITTGSASALQVDANGALIIALGGKSYVLINQANTTCTNLFTVPVRLVEVSNPGITQAHPFTLYDEATAACTGQAMFGNTAGHETTGPLLGPAQFIAIGVRTSLGLSTEWFGGGLTTGSTPYIQVQEILPL
jgi:hypothetical protein